MDTEEKLLKLVSYLTSVRKLTQKNEKIWSQELKRISNKMSTGGYIPSSIQALVDESYVDKDMTNVEEWENTAQNILYPLEHNDEQKEIARKLAEGFGVVVEGPTGTGKTHSIINLICHLLAHNKRILVTSERAKPLRILLDRIPKEIRPLCASVIQGDTDCIKDLDTSIDKVTERLDTDLENLDKDIKNTVRSLMECKSKHQLLNQDLEQAMAIWDKEIQYCGKKYKLLGVKVWLEENESQYSWIEDNINYNEKPLLTDAKFSRLVYLISTISKEEIYQFNEMGPILYNIPPCDELVAKIQRIMDIRRNYIGYKKAVKNWCISYNSDYDYDYIIRLLESTQRFLEDIKDSWIQNILECTKKGETVKTVLQQTILKTNYYIKKIGSIAKEISGHSVEIPKDMDVNVLVDEFNVIYNQYEQKGRVGKLFKLFHRQCQDILDKCRVDGKKIESKEQAKIAKLYIEQRSIEESLRNLWNNSMSEYGAEKIEGINLNVLANLEDDINKIDVIINWDKKIKERIMDSMKKIVFLTEVDWYNIDTYSQLQYGVLSIRYISEYENLKSYIGNIEKLISNVEGFEEIVDALHKMDILLLRQSYKKIHRLKEIAPNIRELEYLLEKVNKRCPKLVQRLLNEEDRLNMLTKYKNFSIAWSWRQLSNLLEEELEKFQVENIKKKISLEEKKEACLVRSLVEKKAWFNTLSKIGESEKRSLYAWKEAVRRIENSSGKAKSNYIKLAKKEIDNFKNFMSVWVMPINKVVENFNLSEEPFDVVIIEDGNESNIFAISALIRAKKAVIVGDHRQMNRESSENSRKEVQQLIDKYLNGIPHSEWFDIWTSIHSTAFRVFPSRVVLRRNFRSLPEIVGFSNKVYYSDQVLSPINFFKNELLGGAVKTVKVEGERDKIKNINIKEAESLVDKIEECCKDPKYNGMTMGVISLLGDAQSELIKNLIEQRISEKEIISRKIICGSPYLFQGDERDVIFLSMVIANNVKFAALTKEGDVRRFSLAASRARKQMWLFHSVDLEDLKQDCIRAKLLKYCMKFNQKEDKLIKNNVYKIA
jgi:superfamily I DNA and/or RNA helicase